MEPDKPTRDPYGTYLAIQAAVRQIEDYTVPDAELDAFILQGDLRPTSMGGVNVYKNGSATVMGYIRMRCLMKFHDVLHTMPAFERSVVFTYAHDASGPTDDPYFLNGEGALGRSSFGKAYDVTFGDSVIVAIRTFRGSEDDIPRVLSGLAKTGAMIFVSQIGVVDPMPDDVLTNWFYRDERFYVPVMEGLLEGMFRPMLLTPADNFG